VRQVKKIPKKIVVCCDGTGNECAESKSNVVKLYKVLVVEYALLQLARAQHNT
jgi:uncharacterized protein (DUF2235 family)